MNNKKRRYIKYISFLTLLLLLTACSKEDDLAPLTENSQGDLQPLNTEDNALGTANMGPWDSSIILATSTDGLIFTKEDALVEHAAVPNLFMTANGDVIATYQYFVEDGEVTIDGAIAYSLSKDQGKTWTDPAIVTIEGLPEANSGPTDPSYIFVTRAVDPTLVELSDGSLRLYFTYQEEGEDQPHMNSAINTDGDISGTFTYEEDSGLSADGPIIDPSVIFFDGIWHHFTWTRKDNENNEAIQSTDLENYHSISDDGLTFTFQDKITLDMSFLGGVVATDDGLRFYGTGNGGVVSAFSPDGYNWEMDEGVRTQGGNDPGITRLEDGTYLLLYTGPSNG